MTLGRKKYKKKMREGAECEFIDQIREVMISALIVQIGEGCIAWRPSIATVDGGGGVRHGS